MNDDIVTRLRETLAHADNIYDIMNEAADEIERLRDALIECETTISRLEIELKYAR